MESTESSAAIPPPKASIKAEQLMPLISYCVAMELKKHNIPELAQQENNILPILPNCLSKTNGLDKLLNLNLEEQLTKILETQQTIQMDASEEKSAVAKNLLEIKCQVSEQLAELNKRLDQVISDNILEKSQIVNEVTTFKHETNSRISQRLDEMSQTHLFYKQQVDEKVDNISQSQRLSQCQLHSQKDPEENRNVHLVQELKELKENQQKLYLDLQSCEKNQKTIYSTELKELKETFERTEENFNSNNEKLFSELRHVQEIQRNLSAEMGALKEAQEKYIIAQKEIIEKLENRFAKENQLQKSIQSSVSTEHLKMKEVHDQIIREHAQINKNLVEITTSQTALKEAQCTILSAQKQIESTQQQLLKDNNQMKENEERILSTHIQTKDEFFDLLRENQELISKEQEFTRAALDQIKESQNKSNNKCFDNLMKIKEEHEALKADQQKQEKDVNNIVKENTKLSKFWEKCSNAQQKLTEDNLKLNNETLKVKADLENLKLKYDKLSAEQVEVVEKFGQVNQDIQNVWKQLEANGQLETSTSSVDNTMLSGVQISDSLEEKATSSSCAIDVEVDTNNQVQNPFFPLSKLADEEEERQGEDLNLIHDTTNPINTDEVKRPRDDPEFYSAMRLYDVVDDIYSEDEDVPVSRKDVKLKTEPYRKKMKLSDPHLNDDNDKTFSLGPEFYCMVVDSDGNEAEDNDNDPLETTVEEVDEAGAASAPLKLPSPNDNKHVTKVVKETKPIMSDCSVVVTRSEKISNLAKSQGNLSEGIKTRSKCAPRNTRSGKSSRKHQD